MDTQASENADILGPKRLNYQFLVLVREKKYPDALLLGQKILKFEPNNPSVKKFCDFILANNKQLQKMVQQQKQEQEYESVDSDEDAQQEEQDNQEGEKQGEQKQEESEQESDDKDEDQQEEQEEQQPKQQEIKPKPKVQLRTCTLNQIPHICTRDHN